MPLFAQVLKNAISASANSREADPALFKQLLQAELAKVSAFYVSQWYVALPSFRGRCAPHRRLRRTPRPLTRRPGRSNALSSELDALERAVRPPGSAAEAGGAPTLAALASAQRTLVSKVVPLLGRLRLFVVLNYTAVVKVRRVRPAQHASERIVLRVAPAAPARSSRR